METTVKEKKKECTSSHYASETPVKRGRLTDYWAKYPEGLLTIVDRRAVLK